MPGESHWMSGSSPVPALMSIPTFGLQYPDSVRSSTPPQLLSCPQKVVLSEASKHSADVVTQCVFVSGS